MKGRLLLEPRETVIESQDGGFVERTESGAVVTREIVAKKCRTQRAGSGKTREDLDKFIKLYIDFFTGNLNWKRMLSLLH